MAPQPRKPRAPGIHEINGNNINMVDAVLKKTLKNKYFNIIIANTIKGYGIKSIENNPAWHHKSPTVQELEIFKRELKV